MLTNKEIIIFLLAFARITSALAVMPILGSQSIPAQAKIGASLLFSALIVPMIHNVPLPDAPTIPLVILNISKEVVVGLMLGFIGTLLFASIELAGRLLAIQIGFGMVNVIDPQSQRTVSVIAQIKSLLASMIFIIIDGHHFLLQGLYQSFMAVPVTTAHFNTLLYNINVHMGATIFLSAIKIGAPIITTLLLTSVAMGLVARVVPQMNVFIVGFPLKIGLGLMAMIISLPIFAYVFKLMFIDFKTSYLALIRALGS